jgi:cytochrome c553
MSKTALTILASLSLAFGAGAAWAGGDAAAGKAKSEACAYCHGEDGKGDDETPALAGLSAADFTKAMTEYQDGTRAEAKMMVKAAKKLSAEDIANLAAYYVTLKP